MLREGTTAPDFTLPDQDGVEHTLSKYRGNWTFMFFYPKDFSPVCTAEACSLQDNLSSLVERNITVLGINADPVSLHKKFAASKHITYPLLSDPEKEVITQYDAKGLFLTKRISYLINPTGVVYKAYSDVDPLDHAGQVLRDIAHK